jgi:ubiquinone/menaquinone biosynthesis C-methylase UbiE
MKKLNKINLNCVDYWDEHIAESDFGLRQQRYLELAGCGKRIIELGCGMSRFLDVARISFKECYGIDFSPKTIQKARKEFPEVKYLVSDATKTPFDDNYFDVAVAGELIEHLEEPKALVQEMSRIAKTIIISTAKMEYNDPEHLWEFTEKELKKLFSSFGETYVEEIKSDWFPGRSYLFVLCLKHSRKESQKPPMIQKLRPVRR